MTKDSRKAPNPLSEEQREILFAVAHSAKEYDLLTPWARKVLYQAGRFDEWFLNRFSVVADTLQEFHDQTDEDELKGNLPCMVERVRSADPGPAGTTQGDIARLKQLVESDLASGPDRLVLAELLERAGQVAEAQGIATTLAEEFPENRTVHLLIQRLKT